MDTVMIANSCRLFNNTEEKIMKLKEFINKAVSVAMCAMIIGTTVVSVNVKADTKVSMEATDALDTHIDDGAAGDTPKIAKMTGSGSSYKYSCLVTATHNNFGGNAESEGIQLKGDYVYFGISDKQSSDKACIYSIPKSAF